MGYYESCEGIKTVSIVTLVSGGLDSTIMALLVSEEGIVQYPLFIDYGQLNCDRELAACKTTFQKCNLPPPQIVHIPGYGNLLSSGLTDPQKRIFEDAFLPCRNLLFLTVGAAYAYQCGTNAISIGLLNEKNSLFPDQTKTFLREAELLMTRSLSRDIKILAPLMSFTKADIVHIAKEKNISGTYSCHAGGELPCGICVACREYIGLEV